MVIKITAVIIPTGLPFVGPVNRTIGQISVNQLRYTFGRVVVDLGWLRQLTHGDPSQNLLGFPSGLFRRHHFNIGNLMPTLVNSTFVTDREYVAP